MTILILLLFFISPVREVVDVHLSIPTQHYNIFCNYSNDNFTQEVFFDKTNNEINAHIKNLNFSTLNLNFRIFPNKKFLADLQPQLREIALSLMDNCITFKNYFKNVSFLLKGYITYSEEEPLQDAGSVITYKKANCVGYSNLVRVLLDAAGIKNKTVKGFYLKKDRDDTLIPVPHRWIEIHLPDGAKFFYDPQYQQFSVNYLTTKKDVNFRQIKKFKVNIIKKSKKFVNIN